jgi:beta-RFAP synthase
MTVVRVSTPSRLHFGLLRLHETPDLSFGGLGLMIDQPRVEVEVAAATRWSVCGPAAKRAARFAELALASIASADKPAALRVRVTSLPPQHHGLGSGTQLALAIAAGVRELVDLPPGTAAELAVAVGRGARSAVGSHGFGQGGLLWERGRVAGAPLSDLTARVSLPAEWRVVLVTPETQRGLSGERERAAFERLPPVPAIVTERLESLAEKHILPAAAAADIDAFGAAVYEYGRLAGECFRPIQGGPYASARIDACVAAIRDLGVAGVGQSSWGPTVFAIVAAWDAAEDLARRLCRDSRGRGAEPLVAAPDNQGAVIERIEAVGSPSLRRSEAKR